MFLHYCCAWKWEEYLINVEKLRKCSFNLCWYDLDSILLEQHIVTHMRPRLCTLIALTNLWCSNTYWSLMWQGAQLKRSFVAWAKRLQNDSFSSKSIWLNHWTKHSSDIICGSSIFIFNILAWQSWCAHILSVC